MITLGKQRSDNMTLYERDMTISFETEGNWGEGESDIERKICNDLHNRNISQVASWHYGNVDDDDYGFKEHTDETSKYVIRDEDGIVMCELKYASEAKLAYEGLLRYGIDCDMKDEPTITTEERWSRILGSFLFCRFDELVGEMRWTGYPHIKYVEDGKTIKMECTFTKNGENFNLKFKILYSVDRLANRSAVEDMIVAVPLEDMRFIRQSVQEILETYTNKSVQYSVDCNTKIISSVDYKCSPDTVNMVMLEEEE